MNFISEGLSMVIKKLCKVSKVVWFYLVPKILVINKKELTGIDPVLEMFVDSKRQRNY